MSRLSTIQKFFPPFRANVPIIHNADYSGTTGRARGTMGFHDLLMLQAFNSQEQLIFVVLT